MPNRKIVINVEGLYADFDVANQTVTIEVPATQVRTFDKEFEAHMKQQYGARGAEKKMGKLEEHILLEEALEFVGARIK